MTEERLSLQDGQRNDPALCDTGLAALGTVGVALSISALLIHAVLTTAAM